MLLKCIIFAKLKRKSFSEDDSVWKIYFNSEFTGEKTENCQNCNIIQGKGQYYLDECNFYNDKDRVINFESISNTLFLHNRCSFSNCTSTEEGNCINYRADSDSSIVQRKFCCTKCQSSQIGQFSYTEVDYDNLNFIIESSLFDVGNVEGSAICQTVNDNIVVSSTNFSSNKANAQPAGHYRCEPRKYTTTFNYSTVVNNLATNDDILNIHNNALIESCNFINNTSSNSDTGIISHWSYSLTVTSCSFINNTVSEGSCLIYNGNDQLTVDSCYIDNSISKTFAVNTVVPTKPREPFTNDFIHLSNNISQEMANKTASIEYFSHRALYRR